MTVRTHEVDGDWFENNVTFFVEVPNSAPILTNISDELFACEGENFYFEYNATDIDEESLTTSISLSNIFFDRFISYDNNVTSFFNIISAQLTKDEVGGIGGVSQSYSRTITVYDGEPLVDSKAVNITVIEVNNIPVVNNELGAQTYVWLEGEDSSFYHEYNVTDVEDGNTTDGNLDFNLSFEGIGNVFEIGAITGIMQFVPTVDELGHVYSIRACVEDNSLSVVHENFSVCEMNGKRSTEWSVCDDFTLTVTDANRAPEIIDWSPISMSLSESGMVGIPFFVEVRDPDGTVPDIDWYVDGVLREHNENKSSDAYSVTFACGVGGLHSVGIVTTDGLLSDSLTWNIDVEMVECSRPVGGGGGGGGSIDSDFCREDWACGDWDVCQNVKRSFDSGVLAIEDYTLMTEICAQNNLDDERFCGFQIKSCIDLNDCTNEVLREERPSERQHCYYTENPSCSDGITNCHDGSCESLVDCGGPCPACPTCSDGIQNQGEEDVDCGGPCPYLCEVELPSKKGLTVFLIIFSIILIGVLGYFGWKLFLILRERYYSY